MIAPSWGEIAERAKLLVRQKARWLRRLYRHRRFARAERRRLGSIVPPAPAEAPRGLTNAPGQVIVTIDRPRLTVLRDPHGEYGYFLPDGGFRSRYTGREPWEAEEYPSR